jgi:hypothetical protein
MTRLTTLDIPGQSTLTVEASDPNTIKYSPEQVGYSVSYTYTYTGFGIDQPTPVKLQFQEGPFDVDGFNGLTPEATLLAVRDHLSGYQNTPLKCDAFKSVIDRLDDCLSILKGRNDSRAFYGTYGTEQP